MDFYTPAHVIEPKYAGAVENYINIGAFYDTPSLREKRTEIMRMTGGYKAYYARAFKLISGAASLKEGSLIGISEEALLIAARRARGIICRELRDSGKPSGKTVRRFLSAITCAGPICLYDTAETLSDRIYVLDNDLGLAHFMVETIATAAEEKGWDTIRCQSPVFPGITEHLIIPELSLSFISQTSKLPYKGHSYRHLRLDAIPEREYIAAAKSEMRTSAKLTDALMSEAVLALKKAKALHDRLEAIYNPHVNFDGVARLAAEHIKALVG